MSQADLVPVIVALVNIVRNAEQEKLLRGIGAKIVLDSGSNTGK